MKIVRTVRGDVPAGEIGIVDCHEHLLISGGPAVDKDPDLRLDDLDDAKNEVIAFMAAGGGTCVDAMPSGCGRDAVGLRSISESTGLHIIATAGFHTVSYYDELHWARRYDEDRLASVLLNECTNGIDQFDSWGPLPQTSGIRPGLLKIGTSYWGARETEIRWLGVIARTQLVTGLPILTHTEHGTFAMQQLNLLEGFGVNPCRVILSHIDRSPDFNNLKALAARGATLCFDGLYRERYRPFSMVLEVIKKLVDAGYADKIVLGGDIARLSMRRSSGTPGIAGLLTELAPRIDSLLGSELLNLFLSVNPSSALAVELD